MKRISLYLTNLGLFTSVPNSPKINLIPSEWVPVHLFFALIFFLLPNLHKIPHWMPIYADNRWTYCGNLPRSYTSLHSSNDRMRILSFVSRAIRYAFLRCRTHRVTSLALSGSGVFYELTFSSRYTHTHILQLHANESEYNRETHLRVLYSRRHSSSIIVLCRCASGSTKIWTR